MWYYNECVPLSDHFKREIVLTFVSLVLSPAAKPYPLKHEIYMLTETWVSIKATTASNFQDALDWV